jgi:hypothetical protein
MQNRGDSIEPLRLKQRARLPQGQGCRFVQRARIDIEPRGALENSFAADGLEIASTLAAWLARQQFAQTPDRGIKRTARAFGIKLWPEQIGEPLAPVRSPRVGEQKAREAAAGRAEFRPSAIIDTCNPENPK